MMSLNTEEEITLRSLSVNLHARQIITIRTSNAHFHLAAFSLIIYINMTCSLHLREVLQCNKALTQPKSIILLWPFRYYTCTVDAKGISIWCKDQLAMKDQTFDDHACAEFLFCPSRVLKGITSAFGLEFCV